MTNLQARILIVLLYFPALMVAGWWDWSLSLALTTLMILCWYEFLHFRFSPKTSEEWMKFAGVIFIGCAPGLFYVLGRPLVLGLGFIVVSLQIYVIWKMIQGEKYELLSKEIAHFVLGLLYITLPLTLLLSLWKLQNDFKAVWFWFLLLVIGASDSMAYFFGRFWGRKPFFQHLSPKKTVEGLWGGMIGATLMGILFHFVFKAFDYVVPNLVGIIILSLACGISGVFGDLFESMLKRHYGVKDSGKIMGGHGGALDRFDAILFASIPLFFYIVLRDGFK